jgi:hypothetical protein
MSPGSSQSGRREVHRYARLAAQIAVMVAVGTGIRAGAAAAQAPQPSREVPATTSAQREADFGALKGRWVRPDGGYVVDIRAIDAEGKLDAGYFNPRPLPFATALAWRDGGTLKVLLELRAGGYDGSTYTLAYDPAKDILEGVYYQAVARQRFNVHFVRAR